jgi:hypothetical protein
MVNVQFYMQVCKIDTSHNSKDWFICLIIERGLCEETKRGLGSKKKF